MSHSHTAQWAGTEAGFFIQFWKRSDTHTQTNLSTAPVCHFYNWGKCREGFPLKNNRVLWKHTHTAREMEKVRERTLLESNPRDFLVHYWQLLIIQLFLCKTLTSWHLYSLKTYETFSVKQGKKCSNEKDVDSTRKKLSIGFNDLKCVFLKHYYNFTFSELFVFYKIIIKISES